MQGELPKGERSEPEACEGATGAGGTLDKRSAVQALGEDRNPPCSLLPYRRSFQHLSESLHHFVVPLPLTREALQPCRKRRATIRRASEANLIPWNEVPWRNTRQAKRGTVRRLLWRGMERALAPATPFPALARHHPESERSEPEAMERSAMAEHQASEARHGTKAPLEGNGTGACASYTSSGAGAPPSPQGEGFWWAGFHATENQLLEHNIKHNTKSSFT